VWQRECPHVGEEYYERGRESRTPQQEKRLRGEND